MRVYTKIYKNGVYTGYVIYSNFIFENGLFRKANQNEYVARPMPVAGRNLNGAYITTLFELKNLLQNQLTKQANAIQSGKTVEVGNNLFQTMDNQIQKLEPATMAAKTQNHQYKAVRMETGGQVGGESTRTVSITIDTTATVADSVKILIGDGAGLISQALGLPALDAVVGGTFGTATLSSLKVIAGLSPFVVKQAQFQTTEATGAIFGGGNFKFYSSNMQNQIVPVPVDYNINQAGTQYQPYIRLDKNFKATFDAWNAFYIEIKKGQILTITLAIESVEAATAQGLYQPK